MLGGVILLLAPNSMTNKFQFAFARIFRAPLGLSRSVTLSARASKPVEDVVSRREYNKLLNHLANVTAQRDQAWQKVETLSGFHRKFGTANAKFVLAEVVKSSSTDVVIDCGQDCHLSKGQFVLADNSIIGSISDVWSQTAEVRLITHPKSKIAVKIGRLSIDAVMRGEGNGRARIRLIPMKYKVRAGDEVFALKAAGLLAAPMIVGRVSNCRTDDSNPLLWDITVKPVCAIDKLSDVAVIMLNQQD
jgi:cell shape-determining protein MreC